MDANDEIVLLVGGEFHHHTALVGCDDVVVDFPSLDVHQNGYLRYERVPNTNAGERSVFRYVPPVGILESHHE